MSDFSDPLAVYHPKAQAEIREAYRRYRAMDAEYPLGISDLADGFEAALIGADWKVASAPHRWAPHIHGTRRVFLPSRFKYSLIDLPDHDGSPVVLACAHHQRDLGYWTDRLPPSG